jgi:hypothetical protein
LQKSLSVRRSDEDPRHLWWSLPLSLRQFRSCFASDLRHADALVRPPNAVDAVDAVILTVGQQEEPEATATHPTVSPSATAGVSVAPQRLQQRAVPVGAMHFRDVSALLDLADRGRVAPCRISIHPGGAAEALFHIDIPQHHTARLQYRFERPGDAVRVLEVLCLGRRFGPDARATEAALLQHEDFQGSDELALQLVLESGTARLESTRHAGRCRTCYLDGNKGYSGAVERRSRWNALWGSWNESRRRFPVNVILFAGLPLFIGFFRASGAVWRRLRP